MTISLRLGQELEQRLAHRSAVTGRTRTYYVRQALLEKLEDLEDIYLSEAAYENTTRWWTQEEMEKELGLDD